MRWVTYVFYGLVDLLDLAEKMSLPNEVIKGNKTNQSSLLEIL